MRSIGDMPGSPNAGMPPPPRRRYANLPMSKSMKSSSAGMSQRCAFACLSDRLWHRYHVRAHADWHERAAGRSMSHPRIGAAKQVSEIADSHRSPLQSVPTLAATMAATATRASQRAAAAGTACLPACLLLLRMTTGLRTTGWV